MNLSAPLAVELGISSRCQLKCNYCSAMPFRGGLAPLDRSLNILDQLANAGVFSVLISGGEPTIHPGVLAIAEVAARRFPISAMNTNGIRHSRRHFAESFYNVASNMLVSISLDSADVVVNDSWRGAAGRLALQAVKNCASVGQRICVSAVVTPESATCVPQLVEELLPYCRAFKFSPIIPRSQAERAALGPNYQSVVEQCFDILEQRFGDSEVQIILPSRKISVSDLGSLELKQLCVCTRTKMYLNEKLECYPCYYSACSENLLGDAACESISEIWSGRKLEAVRDRASQRRLCGSNLRDLLVPSRYEASEVSE